MCVGEPYDLCQVLLVDFTENIRDRDGLGGEPDVIDDSLEARRVIRERELANRRIRAAQAKMMRDTTAREFAITLADKVGMVTADGTRRQELVDT